MNNPLRKRDIIVCIAAAFLLVIIFIASFVCSLYERKQLQGDYRAARRLMQESQSDSAMRMMIRTASSYRHNMNNEEKTVVANSFNTISYLFESRYNDAKRAYDANIRAYKILEETADSSNLPIMAYNLGNFYFNYGDYSSAREQYLQALNGFNEDQNQQLIHFAVTQLLYISIENGRSKWTDLMMKQYRKGYGSSDAFCRYIIYIDSASQSMNNKKYDDALRFIEKARQCIDRGKAQKDFRQTTLNAKYSGKDEVKSYVSYSYLLSARAYSCKHDYDKAISTLLPVFSNSIENHDRYLSNAICSRLSGYYTTIGQRDSADYYTQQSRLINAQFDSIKASDTYTDIKTLYDNVDQNQALSAHKQVLMIIARNATFVAVLLFLIVYLFYNRRLIRQQRGEKKKEKYGSSLLNEQEKKELIERIKYELNTNPAVFSRDFDLKQLSTIVGRHERWVSQVINEKTNKNFSTLLNERRVAEACYRMKDKSRFGQFTLEAIGESVGFKSRTYFARVFKQIMGESPSQYFKESQK